MPLPLILGIAAGIAGLTGVGAGVKGAIDMANANDTLNIAKKRDEENKKRHKSIDEKACKAMDELGMLEMNILSSFKQFADVVEKIKNRPSFGDIKMGNVDIPTFDSKELEQASVGAGILIGGLGGAALGTAGGFAASGAATAAVMALGTASTGTAISSLTGVAATNATLAALGGGSIAAGGGGMALGSTVLGVSTLGVGLLVGGVIVGLVGSKLSDKADKAYKQMLENEEKIHKICKFLEELYVVANNYKTDMEKAYSFYKDQFKILKYIVESNEDAGGAVDWRKLRESDKTILNNVVMLVGLLYHMCKVKLVKKTVDDDQINTINKKDINDARHKCDETLKTVNASCA